MLEDNSSFSESLRLIVTYPMSFKCAHMGGVGKGWYQK